MSDQEAHEKFEVAVAEAERSLEARNPGNKALREENEKLRAKLHQVMDEAIDFSEKAQQFKDQLTTAHEKIGVMKTALKDAEQFCTWLCEDSNKYPGTDAGIAAKSQRHDIRVVLEKVK